MSAKHRRHRACDSSRRRRFGGRCSVDDCWLLFPVENLGKTKENDGFFMDLVETSGKLTQAASVRLNVAVDNWSIMVDHEIYEPSMSHL